MPCHIALSASPACSPSGKRYIHTSYYPEYYSAASMGGLFVILTTVVLFEKVLARDPREGKGRGFLLPYNEWCNYFILLL